MTTRTPAPGRPGSAPRRGIGGLIGVLAVLAFLILAGVILTRRQPGQPPDPPATTTPAIPGGQSFPGAPPAPSAEPSATPVGDAVPVAPADPSPAVADATPSGKPARPRRDAPAAPSAPRAADGATRAPGLQRPAGAPARRFRLGTTSIESLKPVERELAGFEVGGVGVKRAPEVNGRVELEMDPAQVRPGVDYRVKVYLANDGDKDIPVQEVKVSTVENGKSASRTTTLRERTVKPRQRALLHEVAGVWRESAQSWAMDVAVTSARKDVYRNRLRWE